MQRTTRELTKAMTSIVSFLEFTGEDQSMFDSQRLPTLDTEIWDHKGEIKYSFYEKPTVGNRVLLADTALPHDGLQATMIQEVVRRLQNCCSTIQKTEVDGILSRFGQKMINSGYKVIATKIVLVQGVTKHLNNI